LKLSDLPVVPLVFLSADAIDGVSNALLHHGDQLIEWKNQGSAVADFTVSGGAPLLKSISREQVVAFDGVADTLTAVGTKSVLSFLHTVGVFDLYLLFRRRGGSIESATRFILGSGTTGLSVKLTGYFDPPSQPTREEGEIKADLVANTGVLASVQTTYLTPPGEYVKVLVRGTGTALGVSLDGYHFTEVAFGNPLGAGDAQRDYTLGSDGSAAPTIDTLAEIDLRSLVLFNSNLSKANRVIMNRLIDSDAGGEIR